ncbi:MAG: radical SAM protein [Acidobacteria bacterium]|nr:radical SAM protein [Acidobacteriota bacterium]
MVEKLSRYNHFFQMADTLRIVYNARTGAVVRLDSRSWKLVRDGKCRELDPEVSAVMREQGVLVPGETDELALAMEKYRRLRSARNKLMLTIAPTLDCNFACPYCYENRLAGTMSKETATRLIGFVDRRMKEVREVSVTWYGGEPLLAAEMVLSVTKRIRAICGSRGKDVSFFLVSNGYLLTETLASKLASAGISGIQITLDGPPEVHNRRRVLRGGGGTFHRLLESVRIAAEAFKTVKVRMNLDRENRGEWEKLAAILEAAGLSGKVRFEIANVDATNEANSEYKNKCLHPEEFASEWVNFARSAYRRGEDGLLKLPQMTVCSKVSAFAYVIGPGGDIYKCWNDVGDPKKVVSHVSESEAPDKNRQWARFSPLQWRECRVCSLLPACMGRCPDLLEKSGPETACGRWKHCLQEAVILHTMSKLKGGKNGKPEKQSAIAGATIGCPE